MALYYNSYFNIYIEDILLTICRIIIMMRILKSIRVHLHACMVPGSKMYTIYYYFEVI